LEEVISDSDRQYMKKLTHLHEWQFFLLADLLKDLILRPRLQNDGTRPERIYKPAKHDGPSRAKFVEKSKKHDTTNL